MKRSVLLVGLSAFALGTLVVAQENSGTSTALEDGRPTVIYAFDPITGEPLFADGTHTDSLSFNPNTSATPSSGCGAHFQMEQLVTLPKTFTSFVSSPIGLDLDHDGLREFIARERIGGFTDSHL